MRGSIALALVALLGLALAAACRTAAESEAVTRDEVEALLDEYLPVLGRAYAEGEPSLLQPWVAQKEIAAIQKRVDELAAAGQVLEPTLKSVTIEDVEAWGHANAYVTTLEVWDVRTVTVGGRQPISEQLDQTNRVKYQLKRDQGRWRVLYRSLVDG